MPTDDSETKYFNDLVDPRVSTFVCDSCHHKDKRVVKCPVKFMTHLNRIMSWCSVCGGWGTVAECYAYNVCALGNSFRQGRM